MLGTKSKLKLETVELYGFHHHINTLIARLEEVKEQAGDNEVTITINGCGDWGYSFDASWLRPMTETELVEHEAYTERNRLASIASRRATYELLKQEFEDSDGSNG